MSHEDFINDPNVDDLRTRIAIGELLKQEWIFCFRDNIKTRIEEIKMFITNEESKESIDISFEKLSNVVNSLTTEQSYIEKEKRSDFSDLIKSLHDSIKYLFDSFIEEEKKLGNPQDYKGDAIGPSTNSMYYVLSKKRKIQSKNTISPFMNKSNNIFNENKNKDKSLIYIYPSINFLIGSLRNTHEHRHPMPENIHRTKLKYLDNYFSLSAVVLLSMYSYIEMLDLWLDTCKKFGQNQNKML